MKILESIAERLPEKYELHERYLNGQLVRLLKTIGFDVAYTEARGQYLFDGQGNRYLDLLSGWGVFALGRNHPKLISVLSEVLHGGLPHLVQMDVTILAGLLAERLVAKMPPGLEKIFFCNSGTEAVEAALKFARYATKRSKIVYVERGYHGLSYGSLSINGMDEFRDGFGPLLPGLRPDSVRRSGGARGCAERGRRRGVRGRADRRAQRRHPARRLPAWRRRALQEIRRAAGLRRGATGPGPHRKVPRHRALGRRARHGVHGEGALGRIRAGGRGGVSPVGLRRRLSTGSTAPSCTAPPTRRTISRWRRRSRRSR